MHFRRHFTYYFSVPTLPRVVFAAFERRRKELGLSQWQGVILGVSLLYHADAAMVANLAARVREDYPIPQEPPAEGPATT